MRRRVRLVGILITATTGVAVGVRALRRMVLRRSPEEQPPADEGVMSLVPDAATVPPGSAAEAIPVAAREAPHSEAVPFAGSTEEPREPDATAETALAETALAETAVAEAEQPWETGASVEAESGLPLIEEVVAPAAASQPAPEAAGADASVAVPAEVAGAEPAAVSDVTEIEGIGPVYAARLARVGITTISQLLSGGATPGGRQSLAASSGIPERLLDAWVHHADLLRIPGMDPQVAELLEEAGVASPLELAQRNSEALHGSLVALNESRHLAPEVPSPSTLSAWIESAAELPRVVTH